MMPSSRSTKLAIVCAISTTVPSSFALTIALDAAQSIGLFPRDSNTCSGNPDLRTCGGDLPSDFCCDMKTNCIPLNNNRAAICCPKGQDCNVIQPITCDTSQQNVTIHPDSSLHSLDLQYRLASCGQESCCPLGYNCQNGSCWMDKQNAPNSTASPSADNSGAIAHPTSTPSPEDASSAPASSKGGISPGGAAAATFFPAVLLGVALTFLGLWLWRKRKDKRAKKPTELRHSDSLSVTTRNISDPIYDPRYGNRTDFLSNPNSGGSSNYSAQNSANNPFATGALPPGNDTRSPRTPGTSTSDRVRSIFSKSPKDPPPPIMTQRHQSGETIDVLMPPPASYGNGDDAGGLNVGQRNTTFTSMMEQAGFKQSDLIGGQASKGSSPEYRSNPYALSPESGSPARAPGVSPRSRYV